MTDKTPDKIDDAERERRRKICAQTTAMMEQTGNPPTPECRALDERYINGEISLEERGRIVRRMSGLSPE